MTHAEHQKAEWERVRSFEVEARETYRMVLTQEAHRLLDGPKIVEMAERAHNRHLRVWCVAGARSEVLLYVGWKLETDTCTQQYEHMLTQLAAVSEANGLAMARLTKNLYAGD